MTTLSIQRFGEIFSKFQDAKVAVIGDIMLDRYFWGNVSRVSPEAPVPVVDVTKEDFHLGGAANVASNLCSLGLKAELCGIVGNDTSGETFKELCKQRNIGTSGLFIDNSRPTTVKTRVFGNNQQIVRLDRETKKEISETGQDHITVFLESQENLKAIILEDYNKGTLEKEFITKIITYASKRNIPIFVDPKFTNFFNYVNVDLFKPNKKEAEAALGYQLSNTNDVVRAGKELLERLHAKNVLITLGAGGMMLFKNNGSIKSVDTIAKNISDVSGAGDTAIASLTAAYIGGASIEEASTIANYAAGAVCEEPGIVSINYERLKTSIKMGQR